MSSTCEVKFICPECGNSRWGTSGETGNCHHDFCDFSWPRKDDGKYFKIVTTIIEDIPEDELEEHGLGGE